MIDPRHEKLADVLVGYSTAVRPREVVVISGPVAASSMLLAIYRRVLGAGAFPVVRLSFDGSEHEALLLREGSDEQIAWLDPMLPLLYERIDVAIAVIADALERRTMEGVDPARQAARVRSREPVSKLQMERSARGDLRWVLTEFPTPEGAELAGMSAAEYEDFVYRAGYLHLDDPAARWTEIAAGLDRAADFLQGVRTLRIVAEDTDLTVGVGGRRWNRSSGHRNFPDGEVYTGPVETEVDGTIRFSYPGIYAGREIDGIRLSFEAGEVVEATADTNEPLLRELLAMDAGARRLGELAFGLNEEIQTFIRNTLFDEKIGGTMHMALGAGYPETGSTNESALHWDIVCDMRRGAEVYADGELVYRDGRFLPGVL